MAERAEPPVHRVEELWGVRIKGEPTPPLPATNGHKTRNGPVFYVMAFIRRADAEAAAKDLSEDLGEPIEVVRIVTGGADGR